MPGRFLTTGCVAAAALAVAHAQQQPPTFGTTTRTVAVYATVTDPQGRQTGFVNGRVVTEIPGSKAIVPYTDCGGSTDIGTSIRSFACLPPLYLMGHAYTQFGLITQWRAGDVVFANGRQYTISGAFTQSSCQAPARVPAPLSLQTSLTSAGCGSVLVVQGN